MITFNYPHNFPLKNGETVTVDFLKGSDYKDFYDFLSRLRDEDKLYMKYDVSNIDYVRDAKGKPLSFTVNQTMMRVNIPEPLKSGENLSFSIKWWYNIPDHTINRARSGYEYFPKDGNRAYVIAQFFPRMAVYSDVEGWQNHQFWGSGEFALPFGNYEVNITVPADHVLDATGVLQNRKEVFSKEMMRRYEQAKKSYDQPVMIVTQEEVEAFVSVMRRRVAALWAVLALPLEWELATDPFFDPSNNPKHLLQKLQPVFAIVLAAVLLGLYALHLVSVRIVVRQYAGVRPGRTTKRAAAQASELQQLREELDLERRELENQKAELRQRIVAAEQQWELLRQMIRDRVEGGASLPESMNVGTDALASATTSAAGRSNGSDEGPRIHGRW